MSGVGIVVPVYGNAPMLPELHDRIRAALGEDLTEVVYVDDASPDDSLAVLRRLSAADPRVRVLARAANSGQQRALIDGLACARGEWVVTIDADLQDPPEAIPDLLRAGRAGSLVVFAARQGDYESRGRLLTSRWFKRALGAIARIPPDASTFVAMHRDAVAAVLAIDRPRMPFLPGMIACTRVPCNSIPVQRTRGRAPSGYSGADRLAAGLRGLGWAVAARRAVRRGSEEHRRIQLEYYRSRDSPSLAPRLTPYVRRQVSVALDAAALDGTAHVLDVGCGQGRATLALRSAGLEVEGLDPSPRLLADLKCLAPEISLHEGDLASPPPALLDRFDAVFGFFVLHHLHSVTAALRGAGATVRPGGRLVFVEPNALCPLFYVQVAAVPGMSFRAEGGLSRMRPGLLAHAASAAGLTQVEQHTFGLAPPSLANRPRGARAEAWGERVPGVAPFRAFRVLTACRPEEPR